MYFTGFVCLFCYHYRHTFISGKSSRPALSAKPLPRYLSTFFFLNHPLDEEQGPKEAAAQFPINSVSLIEASIPTTPQIEERREDIYEADSTARRTKTVSHGRFTDEKQELVLRLQSSGARGLATGKAVHLGGRKSSPVFLASESPLTSKMASRKNKKGGGEYPRLGDSTKRAWPGSNAGYFGP